jgi:tetratricopeptide (TPR) repeat protein
LGFNREKTLASAQKHLRKGNYDRAIREYEKILEENPSDIRSKLKMADLFVKSDRFEEALQAYGEVAYAYASDDLYEKAAAVYKQALRIAPDDPTLHTQLGEAYFRLGRLKDAVRAFHKAQKIHKRNGDNAAQRDILERMVRIDPEDVGLRIQLAERYEKDELRDDALRLFGEAAEQLKDEGRLDEYVQVCERVIFLAPDQIEMRKDIVRIYLSRGDEKHALKHLQYCFKVTPQDVETLELLGSTFHRLGSNDKALLVYGELAALYERIGEHDRAASAYRTILSIDHTHQRARRFLGEDRPVATPESPPQPPTPRSQDKTPQADALAGIEFLDEDESDDVVEVAPTSEHHPQESNSFMAFAEDTIRHMETDADLNQLSAYPEAPLADENTEAVEISESSLEMVEIEPAETEDSVEGDDQITQFLTESEVFLKYGLLDRAEDVITKVIRLEPDNLGGRDQMRKLLERMGDKRGAAHQLVEMARIDSPRAAQYLRHAESLVDPDVVASMAQSAGIVLEEATDVRDEEVPIEFISEISEGLEEISSRGFEEAPGAHTIDLEADIGAFDVELSGQSAVSDDSVEEEEIVDQTMEDFSVDDFVQEIEEIDELGQAEETAPTVEGTQEVQLDDIEAEIDLEGIDDDELYDLDDFEDVEPSTFGEDVDVADSDDGVEIADFDDGVEIADFDDDVEIADFDDDVEIADFDEEFGFEDFEDETLEIGDVESVDELSLDGADVVDLDIDQVDFDQDELAVLNEPQAGEGMAFDISAEDADAMFDELFGGGMFGGDQDEDERFGDELDIPAMVDEEVEEEPELNHFGSRSLSQKFKGPMTDPSLELGGASVNNSSLELGKTYKDMGLFAEAIEEFEQALEDHDAAPVALYEMALCHLELGQQQDAADHLAALSENEAFPPKWRMMAHDKLEELTA